MHTRESSSWSHLDAGLAALARDAGEGRLNTICIRSLAGAAKLMGEHEIADRAVRLLHNAPNSAFTAGMMTNFEVPASFPDRMRLLPSDEELEEQHPLYREDELLEQIRSCAKTEKHFALCLEGRFDEAREGDGTGILLEEIGDTLALLGEFDAARSVASDPDLEPMRQRGVLFVLLIELFRRGRTQEAEALLVELAPMGLDAWSRIHLALGSGGRVPWSGYPYPDW